MRVQLKGVNRATKRLADGTVRTHWYYGRGKGSIKLDGQPGSPEFLDSYHRAASTKVALPANQLVSVLMAYQLADDYKRLAERTRKDYARQIGLIEHEFGDLPLQALTDRRTRGIFMAWRDQLASNSRRQADYAWAVLALILAWALDRGLVTANPCVRGGRVYRGSRVDKIWLPSDEQAFLKRAPAHLHMPFMLALWTGQRQGDLLRLAWSRYDGEFIRLQQRKTGVRVTIPVAAPLKVMLDAMPRRSPIILLNSDGRPWTSDGFRASWRKACAAAGIVGLTYHDLRGTAVTRLAVAGCTEAEIATLTGHSIKDVRSILDANYFHRDPALAKSGMRKLETRTKLQTELQTVPGCSADDDAKAQ